MAPSGILLTRLLPPRLPSDCLPRPSLTARLVAGMDGRLVTVLAGAGYGKSTIVAEALTETATPSVWMSCDERLGGAPDLLAHIAAGFERLVPGFGAALRFEGPIGLQVTALCNELVATVGDETILVLDDVHLLDESASGAIAELLRDLPPSVHLVLVGRAPLAFPVGKLRAGQLLEVTESSLALSDDEVSALWRAEGGDDDPETLARVRERTEGWVTGVILAAQAGDADFQRRSDSRQLFAYLAEEVLTAQSVEIQDFILQTALFERFSPDLVATLVPGADAREMCRDLVDRHLFAIRLEAEGEWYRYHHLFQAFLRERVADLEPQLLPEMHRRAAACWVAHDQPREAIDHLLLAGDLEHAADLMESVADEMRFGPQSGVLLRWTALLPEDLFQGRPGLTLARAIVTFWGDQPAAFEMLGQAVGDLIESGDHDRAAEAFFMLIYAQLGSGTRQAHAIEVGYRLLPQIDASAPLLPACMVLMASELGCAARYDEADAMLGRVLTLPLPAIDPLGQGYLASARALFMDHPRGHSKQALATIEWVIDLFERHKRNDVLAYIFALRIYRAIILNQLGRYDEVLVELDTIMETARERGITGGGERGRQKLEAVALAGLERWDELEILLANTEPLDAMRGASYGFRTRAPAARLAAHRGDTRAVAHHAGLVIDYVEAFGFSFDTPGWICDVAGAALKVGLDDEARRLRLHVLEGAERAQSPWARARGQLLGAVVLQGSDAEEALSEALDLTAEWDLPEIWTRRDRALAGPLLARAIMQGLGPTDLAATLAARAGGEVLEQCAEALVAAGSRDAADRLLQAMEATRVSDPDVSDALRGLTQPSAVDPAVAVDRPPLTILALGGFLVRRGDEAVPVSAFGRERARAVLAALVCAGGPVHRERLVDWLWPDLDLERGLRALHVTLHGLRRALEPELGRGSAARSVIRSEGESYRLVLRDGDRVDVEQFMALLRRPPGESERETLRRLQAAERAYRGPLYPEWPYADWAESRRREVELSYSTVLSALADLHLAAGAQQEALVCLERLVALEPEREAFHRSLMAAYAQAGEKALALRQYHACRSTLRRELGVEASAETRALYQLILEDQPIPDSAALAAA
ncbi:MAG TPA: BTAD domain-containing putative transcriptional regulator [Miltoncostaeaceae bacterium]|nr:BTAD domain-containing putative transcriptional regulator [Miltoncostaeaceae bacterium]